MDLLCFDEKNKVVYEDENVIVIYKRKTSDFLFVTFGDSTTLAFEHSIYAETVSSKLGYSSLGFMPKSRNWYPEISMRKAIDICKDIISMYGVRIAYSGSMGAYAAIKYSRLLMTTSTIACCPQWSIAPRDCQGIKNKYEKYYTDEMLNMRIEKEDIFGDIYLIYDPKHRVDSFHFSKIHQLSCEVHPIAMPYVRHHVTTAIAGTKNVKTLVDAVLSKDVQLFKRIITKIKRNSIVRQDNLLRIASISHPFVTAKIIINSNIKSEGAIASLNYIVRNYLRSKDFTALRSIYMYMSTFDEGNEAESGSLLSLLERNIFYNLKVIKSHHECYLVYDLISKSLRQLNASDCVELIGIYKIVKIMSVGGEGILVVENDDSIFPIITDGTIFILSNLKDFVSNNNKFIKSSPVENGFISLSFHGVYLTANKNGQVQLNCKNVKDWERFTVH